MMAASVVNICFDRGLPRQAQDRQPNFASAAYATNIPERAGMSLIELLIVMAIIGLSLTILLPAVQSARRAAWGTQCLSNMRDCLIGFRSDSNDSITNDRIVLAAAKSRETRLRLRLCPLDPLFNERMAVSGTSYIRTAPSCDQRVPIMTSKTIVLLEAADTIFDGAFDPCPWFADREASTDDILLSIKETVALQRHGDGSNVAYADGHVATIPVSAIEAWVLKRHNFALRNNGEFRD